MKPARYFVRVFTPDPREMDADDQEDFNETSLDMAKWRLRQKRDAGLRAALYERVNISPDGITPFGWDFEEKVIRDTHE